MAEEIKKKKTEIKLDPKVWEVPYNEDLIVQVLYVLLNNERKGTSEVKGKFKVIQFFTRPYLYFDTASFIRLRIVHRILSELEPISFYRMGKILRI